jgi:hypothetical protein
VLLISWKHSVVKYLIVMQVYSPLELFSSIQRRIPHPSLKVSSRAAMVFSIRTHSLLHHFISWTSSGHHGALLPLYRVGPHEGGRGLVIIWIIIIISRLGPSDLNWVAQFILYVFFWGDGFRYPLNLSVFLVRVDVRLIQHI